MSRVGQRRSRRHEDKEDAREPEKPLDVKHLQELTQGTRLILTRICVIFVL